MKDYIKAKEYFEKLDEEALNKKREKRITYAWMAGFIIVTTISIILIMRYLDKKIDILFLGPVKIVAGIFTLIGVIALFTAVATLIPILSRRKFMKELMTIVDKYIELGSDFYDKFYIDLVNMEHKPKQAYEITMYYLNIANALLFKGEIEEGIFILNLLDENPHSLAKKEYINSLKSYYKEDLRLNLTIVLGEINKIKIKQ